jgi:HEAT repeat protein
MTITPESIEQQLQSENLGDRLRAVNDLRQLDPPIAFELVQPAIVDKSARVRYAAVSQMTTIGRAKSSKLL